MSKTKISEFSTTPGNNTDINGINISEGCAPSGINNAIRELMSDLKEWQSGAMDVYVIPQGTAAAPGIQLYGDLDTGLYGFAANQLGVAVGGASAGYFSSAGWVGNVVATTVDLTNIEVTNIKAKDGTTSISIADSTGIATFSKATVIETTDNTNAALRITQLGTGNALLVEDATNPDTTPTVIDQFGNVILGTTARTTPVTSKVEIHSTSSENLGLTPSLGFYNWSVASTTASHLSFRHYPSGTVGTLAANTLGDVLGRVVFLSYDGTNAFSASIVGVSGAGGASPSISYSASGGHNFTSGPIDVENLEVTNIKARDGTAAASIADSTGVMTIASSVLTTTDINGGTIDGAVIGGSSAAAGTFTTITGTQVNSDNLRLDGNTLSSTDTNGNIVVAPNGTGITTFSNYLKTGNLEVGQAALGTNLIKATNTNGGIYLQTNGTGLIFADAASIIAGNASATTKITTNGASDLVLDTNDGSNSGSITIQDGVNGNILIAPNGTGQVQLSGALDVTNIEVTNIKAKDGTAALSIADSTGVVSVSANPVLSGGTANGVVYLNASKVATSGSGLTYDGTTLVSANGSVQVPSTATFKFGSGFTNYIQGDTSSNYLLFATNSTEKLRITSGGQVNIGGNFTSTNNTLQVTGNAAIGYTTAAPTTGLIVAGNVGIGTNSPAGKLSSVVTAAGAASLTLERTGSSRFEFQQGIVAVTGDALRIRDTTLSYDYLMLRGGNVGINATDPGYKLEVNGGASDAMSLFNSTNANGAHLRFAASGTVKSYIGGAPGFLGSGTADDLGIRAVGSILFATAGSGVDMTLDSSGNLGIGAAPGSPAYGYTRILDVAGQFPGIKFTPSGASTFGFQIGAGTGGFQFYDVAASAERMRIDASGNLVVGDTSTSYRLKARADSATGANQDVLQIYNGALSTATASLVFGTGAYAATCRISGATTGANNGALVFGTDGGSGITERARITSVGGFETRPAATGHAVFNEDGVDADFRVESDTQTHMLFVDAGNDRVGIGTNSPLAPLDVTGVIRQSGISTQVRTASNATGGAIFLSPFGDVPITGWIHAVETGTSKYIILACYKESTAAVVTTTTVASNGLGVQATNSGGTVTLNGFTTSGNVKMVAYVIAPTGAS